MRTTKGTRVVPFAVLLWWTLLFCCSSGKSTLQVDVTKAVNCAESRRAGNGDKVTVHYGGFLTDGKKFDSSFDRRKPFTFSLGVGQVIPGWDQGLLGVCPGEERHLVVPAELAYGEKGAGDFIPPGATLLFDVVVVDVEQPEPRSEAEEEEKREKPEQEHQRFREPDEKRVEDKRKETASTQSRRPQQQPRQDPEYYGDYEYETEGDECPNGRLQVEVVREASTQCNRRAEKNDKLSMHYTGRLTSGLKFDSSKDRNKPFDFTLGIGQVIQGWDEGVTGMCVGEVRQLTVPPFMAYGKDGVGSVIPSCATLVFEVELLDIV